jgi:hypothetical protein
MKHGIPKHVSIAIAGACVVVAGACWQAADAQPVETGPLTIGGSLLVHGPVTVEGPLSVAGEIFVHGPLTAGWLARLPVNDPALVRRGGRRTFNGPLTVHGPLVVQGDLEVGGPLTVNGPAGAVENIDAEGPIVERRFAP